jgi:hypothetical protein
MNDCAFIPKNVAANLATLQYSLLSGALWPALHAEPSGDPWRLKEEAPTAKPPST